MSEGGAKISVTAAAASQNLGMRAKSAKKTVASRRKSDSDISKAFPATGAKGIENLKARMEKAKETVAVKTADGAAEIENAVTGQPGLDTQPADTVTDTARLEFPPELTGWSRVNVPAADFDCLVHTMLIALSPTFRKQPLGIRNAIASKFRRDGPFSKTEGLTDEEAKRIAANQTYLQTPELEKFAKQNGLNFLIVAKTSGATQAGILKTDQKLPGQKEASVLEGKAGAPVYVIYNDNQNHFEAVHSPAGEYSMPYDEAIKIAKNFNKDVTPEEAKKLLDANVAAAAPASPTPSENPAPVVPGSPPVLDDFGFIKTNGVDPPNALVHSFELKRDGDTLKPSMKLMGSDPAVSKIATLKTGTKERTRADKKAMKDSNGKAVMADSVIVGIPSEMEIPLFHFASDVEKFLDNPSVVPKDKPILPPTSPLLVPRAVPAEKAISFNLKSSPGVTFGSSSANFNSFYVGPVGEKDHRVALHGFLVSPVTDKIAGVGDRNLQAGFEMVSILTGTLGDTPAGEVVPPLVPPPTPVLAPTPAPAVPTRGRSPTPKETTDVTVNPDAVGAMAARSSSPPPLPELPSPFTTEVGVSPTAVGALAARSASPPPAEEKLSANKQLVQDMSQQASELIRMEAARDKAEADIAGAGDVSPQRRLQLINIAQQRKKFAADARKKWEAMGKKVLDVAEKDHEKVKKAHGEYKATLKEKKDAAKAAAAKVSKLEKAAADSKAALDKEVAKGDKSTNKRKEALAKTSVQAAKDVIKAKADATEADADAALWAKDEQKVDEGLANSAKNLEEVRKTVKDPRYVPPTPVAVAPGAVDAMAQRAASPANAVQPPVNTALQPQPGMRNLLPTPEAPVPADGLPNPMRSAPEGQRLPRAAATSRSLIQQYVDGEASPALVNPLAPTPEGLAARAAAEQRLGLGERGTLGAPVAPEVNTPLVQGEVVPPVAPAIAPEVAASLDAFNPNATPAPAPAPATTGTAVPERTVSIDSGVMTSLDEFAPRRPHYTAPVTEAAPPIAPSPTSTTGTIDDSFDTTFRDAVTNFIRSIDTELKLKLLNDENVEEAFKDKRLTSYIADVKKNHQGQAFTLQFPSHEFMKSSAAKGTGWNTGGGDWEIPVERKMGGDTVFISIDKFKYGSTLVQKKKGGARPTGPTFRFEFELNYPHETVGGRRRYTLKRKRTPASRLTRRQ